MFAAFFTSFLFERGKQRGVFEQSRQLLNADFGGINTLILLTSSWLVVLAVKAARTHQTRWVPHLLGLAMLCGVAFGGVKIAEYTEKFEHGLSMLTNDFFMFYFVLTVIHFLHVIAGTVVLGIVRHNAQAGAYSGERCTGLESAATYWHMVDLIWILLFPLLYLLR